MVHSLGFSGEESGFESRPRPSESMKLFSSYRYIGWSRIKKKGNSSGNKYTNLGDPLRFWSLYADLKLLSKIRFAAKEEKHFLQSPTFYVIPINTMVRGQIKFWKNFFAKNFVAVWKAHKDFIRFFFFEAKPFKKWNFCFWTVV